MFDLDFYSFQKPHYTLAATGMKMHAKVFYSREDANTYMYNIIRKKGLAVRKVWHDHHDVTYICNNDVRFYVQRA